MNRSLGRPLAAAGFPLRTIFSPIVGEVLSTHLHTFQKPPFSPKNTGFQSPKVPSKIFWKILKKCLHFPKSCGIITKLSARQWYALLAQLDRASGYGPEGQGFESLGACQKPRNRKVSGFFLFHPNIFLVKSSGFRIFWDGNVVQESSSFLNTWRIFRTFSAQIPFKRKNDLPKTRKGNRFGGLLQ